MKITQRIKIVLSALAVSAGVVSFTGCRQNEAAFRFSVQTGGKEIGTLSYTMDSGSVTLTRFTYGKIALEVPAEIDGKAVVGIADNAFSSDDFLYEIYLPDTVETLGAKSFSGLKYCTGVYTSGDPKKIATNETTFESSAVQSVSAASPDSSELFFCEADFKYKDNEEADGVLITGYKAGVSLDIPSEIDGSPVLTIDCNAFFGTKSLKNIVVPETVTEIKSHAFSGCADLVSVEIPASVTKISDHSFYNCSSLKNVSVGGSGSSSEGADLSNITEIGGWAFGGCSSLPLVTLSESLTTIESGAFSRCSALAWVDIPASVNRIESSVFDDCSSLDEITVADGNKQYCAMDGVLYNKKQTELLKYPEGRAGEFTIPSTVKTIGEYALKNCKAISVVPKNVTSVKYGGLRNASSPLSLPNSLNYAEGTVCDGTITVYFAGKSYSGSDFDLHRSINAFPIDR